MEIDSVQSWRILLTGHQKVATWSFFLISVKLCVIKKYPITTLFLAEQFCNNFLHGFWKYAISQDTVKGLLFVLEPPNVFVRYKSKNKIIKSYSFVYVITVSLWVPNWELHFSFCETSSMTRSRMFYWDHCHVGINLVLWLMKMSCW